MKNKKILWIILGAIDVAVVGFLFVVHILMLANIVGKSPEAVQEFAKEDGFLPFLVANLNVYGFAFVLPLFLILAANVVGLVLYIRRNVKKAEVKVSDLSAEEKEALRKELLADLNKDAEPKAEEKKEQQLIKKTKLMDRKVHLFLS